MLKRMYFHSFCLQQNYAWFCGCLINQLLFIYLFLKIYQRKISTQQTTIKVQLVIMVEKYTRSIKSTCAWDFFLQKLFCKWKNRMANSWQQEQSLTVLLHTVNKVSQPSILSLWEVPVIRYSLLHGTVPCLLARPIVLDCVLLAWSPHP